MTVQPRTIAASRTGQAGEKVTFSDPQFEKSGYWDDKGTPYTGDDSSVNGDYHLRSEYGRWSPNGSGSYSYLDPNDTPSDPNDDFWVIVPGTGLGWIPDTVTSPCIDAGKPDPNDWHAELWPHGRRINMGAYGGTAQASMSGNPVGNVADLDHDDAVSLVDLMLFSEDWLYQEYLLDTDLNRNGKVDIIDFAAFAQEWLWPEP